MGRGPTPLLKVGLAVREVYWHLRNRSPTVAEILTEEFMEPMGLTQGALAEAMGVQRKPNMRS